MGRIGDITRSEIRDALSGKGGVEAHTVAKEISKRLSMSIGYVYRITEDVRLNGRATRHDRGEKRVELLPEIEGFMEGLTKTADFSADHAVWITARHFNLPENFMSTVTYNSWLRQKRMSRSDNKKDLRPYRSFEASRPNFMHHYDTTVAEAFYANDDGSIGHEAGHKRYKNKPGNRRPRLNLYSLVDDRSRVIFARFYFSENALNLLDFVLRAWSKKDDKRFPFYGIPDCLYADQGSPRKSAKFVNAMEKLGVKILDTTPSHSEEFGSRKHGKVERTFGEGLLGEFMKITRIFRFASIEELNATLWDWLIHTNNRVHSVTREKRFSRWLVGVGTPRCMPSEEMFKLLHYDHDWRTVKGNLQLDLNGQKFQLPYKKPFINWVNAKVEVFWYPGHEDVISVVYDNYEEEVRALAPVVDIALDYKKVAKTDKEKRVEELKGISYAAVNFPSIYSTDSDVPYVPRAGKEFDSTRIAEKTVETPDGKTRPSLAPMRYLDRFKVRDYLTEKGIFGDEKLSDAERSWLASLMNGRSEISEEEVDEAVKKAKAQTPEDIAEEG